MIKSFSLTDIKTNPSDLVAGLKETGFAIITDHGIEKELMDAFYREWRRFFGKSSDVKLKYLFNKSNQSGFFPMGSEKAKDAKVGDLKEFYHYYAGVSQDPTNGITQYMADRMNRVGFYILSQIENGLPDDVYESLSSSLTQMILNTTKTLFRVIHYPAMPGAEVTEGAMRAAAHEDINLITLLPMATAEGLQVLSSSGEWLDVGGDPNALVINVGDMLQEATGGYLRSTTHRVVNMGMDNPRYSAPLFIHPRPDVKLSDRHTADSYLTERLKELGLL